MKVFHNIVYDNLTEKQRKAVDTYLENGFDIKDAAKKSGYSEAGLRKWLKSEKARICLREYTAFLIDNRKDVLEYRLIDTYITRAFYNPADIIDVDGYLIVDDLKKLGPLAVCVESIETEIKGIRQTKDDHGNVHTKELIKKKVTLANREKALEQLSRYMKIMSDQIELTGKDGGPVEIWSLSEAERKKRIAELLAKQKK